METAIIHYPWLSRYNLKDKIWTDDFFNWDDAVEFAVNDVSLLGILSSPITMKIFIFIENMSKFSFLDHLFIGEALHPFKTQELYSAIVCDLVEIMQTYYYPSQFFFYTNEQEFMAIMVHHAPEILLAYSDFVSVCVNNTVIKFLLALCANIFTDSVVEGMSTYLPTLALGFVCLMWFMLIFLNVLKLTKLDNTLEHYLTRLSLYFYSLSKENRLQLEALTLTVLLFTFLSVTNLLTFRDLYEESIESVTLSLFYIFVSLYLFFLYKTSVHYFSFLEASVPDRKVLSVFIQFLKDVSNSVIIVIRFMTLLVRLNIYDAVDDVLDSNYIFAGDFQDECYTNNTWIRLYSLVFADYQLTFDSDKHHTYSLTYFGDLFTIYFFLCVKLLGFIFFALEAAGRAFLAFFIVYLVIFDMHAINRSYTEDDYANTTRRDNF